MASSTLTIRLDTELKEEAARVVARYGLDLSTAIRVFFTQIVNTNAIPLSFSYEQQGGEQPAFDIAAEQGEDEPFAGAVEPGDGQLVADAVPEVGERYVAGAAKLGERPVAPVAKQDDMRPFRGAHAR